MVVQLHADGGIGIYQRVLQLLVAVFAFQCECRFQRDAVLLLRDVLVRVERLLLRSSGLPLLRGIVFHQFGKCPVIDAEGERLLRAILPDVLIDNFDIVNFDKSADRFDIYLDEKKVQLKEDKTNPDIISYGFGEYRTIQDYPIRGRATYLHVRKRKWLDKSSNEIFSYDWDLSEFDGTRLNSEFVSFLKEGD